MVDTDAYLIAPVMNLAVAKQRLKEFREFVQEYLVENEDYGVIPGTQKPTLYKPGADKLCEIYGLADDYVIVQQVEDYDRGLFDYTMKCNLTKKGSGIFVASGLGNCNSYESKYRWREGKRKCPACGAEAIIKGREEYGGGWLCFAKKGGCGSKFLDGDKRITEQTIGRVLNPDMSDSKNTILKMSLKRSKVSAVLSATRSSGLFTQDMEDLEPGAEEPRTVAPAQAPAQPAKAATSPPAKAPAAKKQPPKETAQPAAQAAPSGPPKANIPPMEPTGTNGKQKKDLKTWARELAAKVQSSPDQLVFFLKRILRVEDLKGAPEGQKIVALNALERVAAMTWPTGMNAVTAFVRNEGLSADFKAVETAYADLLSTVSDQPPTA
jgi:hypothetical protein